MDVFENVLEESDEWDDNSIAMQINSKTFLTIPARYNSCLRDRG